MIYNPVIVSGGGARYKITVSIHLTAPPFSDGIFPDEATPGQLVTGWFLGNMSGDPNITAVTDAGGNDIPFVEKAFDLDHQMYFVMPASDVTIT